MAKSVKDILGLFARFRGALKQTPPEKPHLIKVREALENQGPSWWGALTHPDLSFAHKTSMDTWDTVTNKAKFDELKRHAQANLSRWSKEAPPVRTPPLVKVTPNDWSIDTIKMAKETGRRPAVLTNASAEIPGGAYPLGTAQEEELFRTTTAPRYLQHAFKPAEEGETSRLHYNVEENTFMYTPEERLQIIGAKPMNEKELKTLTKRRKQPIKEANKVYLHHSPLILFKSPAFRAVSSDPNSDPSAFKKGYVLDTGFSYKKLPDDQITPFWDLISAAPRLADGTITLPDHKGGEHIPVDWQDPKFLEAYYEDMRRRVGATLDTLIINGKRNAVLTALGCGAYENNPTHVARIFEEELAKRPNWFHNVVFSVKVAPGLEEVNYKIFKDTLDGMPLTKDGDTFSFFNTKRVEDTSVSSEEKQEEEITSKLAK